MDRKRVTILQEFIPAYRVDFFNRLREVLRASGVDLEIAAGSPSPQLATRQDSSTLTFATRLRQAQFAIGGVRITLRLIPLRALRSDLIITEQARRNFDTYLLLTFRSRHTALWGHGADHVNQTNRLSRALLKLLSRRAAHLFIYAASTKTNALTFPNITYVNNSKPEPDGAGQVRQHTPNTARMAFLGALDPSKETRFLIQAADLVAARVPNFLLQVVGTGPDEQHLRALAATRPHIEILGRQVGSRLSSIMRDVQLIAIPGRVGLVAVDSLHFGRPIITTHNQLHAPEFSYLKNGQTCLVTPPSVQAYANGIVSALQDRDLLSRLQANCAARRDHFSLDKMVDNFAAGIIDTLEKLER